MFIDTRYSTIYAIQKNQSIKAINENENNENNRRSFSAEFESSYEKSKMDSNELQKDIVGKDIKSAIENVKFLSNGKMSKISATVRALYEADNMRYAVETSNFMDLSNKIEEWIDVEPESKLLDSDNEFNSRWKTDESEDFESSFAYRESVKQRVLEGSLLELRESKENNLSKKQILSEVEQDRYGFNFRKVS